MAARGEDAGYRNCARCGAWRPVSDFPSRGSRPDGSRRPASRCAHCDRKRGERRRRARGQREAGSLRVTGGYRNCSRCGSWRPLADFPHKEVRPDGSRRPGALCPPCARAAAQEQGRERWARGAPERAERAAERAAERRARAEAAREARKPRARLDRKIRTLEERVEAARAARDDRAGPEYQRERRRLERLLRRRAEMDARTAGRPFPLNPRTTGYVFGLVVEQPGPHRPVPGEDPLLRGLRDAEEECQHGRLPGDRTPACGCWREPSAPGAGRPSRVRHRGRNGRV